MIVVSVFIGREVAQVQCTMYMIYNVHTIQSALTGYFSLMLNSQHFKILAEPESGCELGTLVRLKTINW